MSPTPRLLPIISPSIAAADPGDVPVQTQAVSKSALEFIRSGRFSGAIVLSSQRLGGGSQSSAADNVTVDESTARVVENAAKLSLLLTRSYVDCASQASARNNLSSIQLGDFIVNYDQEITGGSKSAPPILFPAPPKNQQQQFTQQEGLPSFGGLNNASEALLRSVSTGSHVSPSSSPRNNGLIILRGVDISAATIPTDIEGDQHHQPHHDPSLKSSQIQVLGKILYSIFCLGQTLPSDILQALSAQDNESQQVNYIEEYDECFSNPQRSSRRFRAAKKTVFTMIIENNASLPKSVCRFLSNMIDNGPNCESGPPFTSFEDVMSDLEHMAAQPHTFLHDLHQSSPLFGQKYYSRKEEVLTLMKLAIQIMEPSSELKGVQAAFVSGMAGNGKSKLVESVTGHLSSLSRWIIVKSKFERGMGHASGGIVSSMFNEIVNCLVKLKKSESPTDVAYTQRVSKSMLDSVGKDTLAGMVDFLPSLPKFFDDTDTFRKQNGPEQTSYWQLVISLTKIISAILESGRYIMICCDDLQWADRTSLALVSEVLVKIGSYEQISHRLLFVGMYRSNEIDEDHPFSIEYSNLQMSSSIDMTEIKLSSLSKEDVSEMLMGELRLPRRLVVDLADAVHKKTAGHAFFVVELLNSLLRDSIVAFSSEECRYTWDDDRIDVIQTGDNVAEFIASNLKSLTEDSLHILQMLSCFGTQTDNSLLQLLEKFNEGTIGSIDAFIERGILDKAGPIVIFTHDLIHEAVYESMPLDDRKSLHLRMGQFIGASIDAPLAFESMTKDFGQLHLKGQDQAIFSGRSMSSTVTSITCDQVNAACQDCICDQVQKETFAKWNLRSAQSFAVQSDFSAALHYYSNGIEWMGDWSINPQLCLELHQGAVLSCFALGDTDNVDRYAKKVIEHLTFEEALDVQVVVLKSLSQAERHQECITRGNDILRRLGFQIPLTPSPQSIWSAMASTANMASHYSSDQLASLCQQTNDDSTYAAVRITDAIYVSAHTTTSPFLAFLSCEVVKFSLLHGCCPEAAMSFATYAFFKTAVEGDYLGGRFWAALARKIIKSNLNKNMSSEIRTEILLHLTIDNFFEAPNKVADKLMNRYHDGMKIGQVDGAMIALVHGWRFRLFGGYNLSLFLQSIEDRLELTIKHSKYSAKYMALDTLLVLELTGTAIDCSSAFGYSISNIDDVRSEDESSDTVYLTNIHTYKMFKAYWKEKFEEAGEHFQNSLGTPGTKTPRFITIHQTLYGGLVAFQLHRQMGGNNDLRLQQGRAAMKKLEEWPNTHHGNKMLLLQAEHSGTIGEHDKAQLLYRASIKAAKDHGNVHELALSYELFGNHYCLTNGCGGEDSNECFRNACVYYEQWGAIALAEKIRRKHNLRMDTGASAELQPGKSKHSRNGD